MPKQALASDRFVSVSGVQSRAKQVQCLRRKAAKWIAGKASRPGRSAITSDDCVKIACPGQLISWQLGRASEDSDASGQQDALYFLKAWNDGTYVFAT